MISTAYEILARQEIANERLDEIARAYSEVLAGAVLPRLRYMLMCVHVRDHQFDGMTAS